MGYQRSAPEIFRQEAPRQLQDAMVFLQPAAVMTAAAILGVAVFSDVGGSGGVDNARDRAASKMEEFQSKSFSSSRATDSFKMPKAQDYSGMSRESAEGKRAAAQVGAAKSALSQARSAEVSAMKAQVKARDAEASALRQAKSAEEKATLAKKDAVGASAIAKKRAAQVASALSELDKAEAQVATVEGNAAESTARAAVERAQKKAAAARDSETRALAMSSGI